MPSVARSIPEVFSAREIARAAGVSPWEVRRLVASEELKTLDGRLAGPTDAVRAVRILRGLRIESAPRDLFRPPVAGQRPAGRALAASGALHGALLCAIIFVTSLGLSSAPREPLSSMRLVFLPIPGPGGGGGGGGLRKPTPPPRAELKGAAAVRSPVPPLKPITSRPAAPEPVRQPPPVRPEPIAKPVEPPPPSKPEPKPQVVAPLATTEADPRDRAGVLTGSAGADSQGPGSGGGAGTGQGTGLGAGDGAGVGPGTGGGTGGGPYRPGSGITPPGLLHEVKPDYTDEARRRGVIGDVVLEIVVRSDGTVGSVKILQRLGAGLDERAAQAVRAWRFSPARRFGTPVDVVVEVAVEFKLR